MIGEQTSQAGDAGEVGGWLRANRWRLATRVDDALLVAAPATEEDHAGGASDEVLVNLVGALGVAAGANAPELFLAELGWDKVYLAARGRAARDIEPTIAALRRVLATELPPGRYAALGPYLDVAAQAAATLPTELPCEIDPDSPSAPMVRRYLDALFAGDWRGAGRMIVEAAERGVPVETLYLDVLQVAQREIGRLWLQNQITVAEEHYCTAVARQLFGLLQPRRFASGEATDTPTGPILVAASVADELHELAPRMVADFFDLAGWQTYFLGADTPLDSLIDAAVRRHADVVALSSSLTLRVPSTGEAIRAIRARPELAGVIVLVGGRPFELAPHLWEVIGADGYAASAAEAVTVGERLLAARAYHPAR